MVPTGNLIMMVVSALLGIGIAVILAKQAGMVTVELIILALAIAMAGLAWLIARKAFPKEEMPV